MRISPDVMNFICVIRTRGSKNSSFRKKLLSLLPSDERCDSRLLLELPSAFSRWLSVSGVSVVV